MTAQTIVVVDDEPALLALFRDLLMEEGYEVVTIGHPSILASQVARLEPSLFLLDIMLPGMSGIELAAELHEAGYGETPMVAMSASRRMIDRAAECGWFTRVLEKPFDFAALIGSISLSLDGREPLVAT